MPANPEFNRQSLRLRGHDYSGAGFYFITLCTNQKIFHFGAIFDNGMVLNEIGRVAENEWFKLADRFRHIQLSPFCIMPNHIHGIIQITSPSTSSSSSSSLEESNQEKEGKRDKVSLGSIIGKYKSLVMKECLNQNKEKYPKDQLYRYLEKSGNEIIMSTLSELGNYMIKLRDI